MSQPTEVLERTEGEIAALLVAGLATQRAGRDRLEELAEELSALKLERLAAELRRLAAEADPRELAASALTSLAMTRKIRERLAPWPAVSADRSMPLAVDPAVRVVVAEAPPENPDQTTLIRWLETGDELLRAHAAELVVRGGEGVLPELARLAAKATPTVRRAAIAVLGRIGGEAALKVLAGLIGDATCHRALLGAILPYGERAVPTLADILGSEPPKKGTDTRRIMAAALLFRLGAYSILGEYRRKDEEDPLVRGFALAARMRAGRQPEELDSGLKGLQGDERFSTLGVVTLAGVEVLGDIAHLIDIFERSPVSPTRAVAAWIGPGSPVSERIAAHYLEQLARGAARERQVAAAVLRGLALPEAVPSLTRMVEAGEVDLSAAAEILGETGGGQAAGVLLDLAHRPDFAAPALKALKQMGEPGTAPALVELLDGQHAAPAEAALIALGDAAVDFLGRELRAREGTPMAGRIEQILMQIGTRRAKETLKGRDLGGVQALVTRLGHPKLGPEAAKALARHGEAVLDLLENVLATGTPEARADAVEAVGAIKGERAYEIIYRVAEAIVANAGTGTAWNRPALVRAIALLPRPGDERSIPVLVQGLASANYYVREEASRALVKAGPSAGIRVVPLLEDHRPDIRAIALQVVGHLATVEAEGKAIELLQDGSPNVRHVAAKALGNIGAITRNPRIAEALGSHLEMSAGFWPQDTIEAIVKVGRREAIPYLRRFAKKAETSGMGSKLRSQVDEAIQRIEAASPAPPTEGLAGRLRSLLRGR